MTGTSHALHIEQINELVQDFVYLRPRFEAMLRSRFGTGLPEDLAHLKERLGELPPEGGPKRLGLFYHIGVVLSRQKKPLSMGELSEVLGTPLSTTTRMADWLVESGFVERLSDPEDRRVVRLALTEMGRKQYHTIDEFIKQRIEQTFSSITPQEWGNLVILLRKLVEALEEVL
jgi:DNA-binding MarR family transcriptional regulator